MATLATPEQHLTKLENKGEDWRIIQGRRFELTLTVDGDRHLWTFAAQIRKSIKETSTLAVFNVLTPSYDVGTDKTTAVIYLTKSQTAALPIPSPRATVADTKPGSNVWVWDAIMTDPSDAENVIAIVSYSWVEVVPRVTQ